MDSVIIDKKKWTVRLIVPLLILYILYCIFTFWSFHLLHLHDQNIRFSEGNAEFYGGMVITGFVVRIILLPFLLRQGYVIHHDKDTTDYFTQIRLKWTCWLELYLFIGLITSTVVNAHICTEQHRNSGEIPSDYIISPIMECVTLFWPLPILFIMLIAFLYKTNCHPFEIV